MDILTITCHRVNNYGAVLQSYALVKYLSLKGNSVKVIDYKPDYIKKNPTKKYDKHPIKKAIRLAVRSIDYIKGDKVFEKFIEKYVEVTPNVYRTLDELNEHTPSADLYITGSDQVWNYEITTGNDDSYFLSFVKKGEKISYAASMAVNNIHEDQVKRFKTLLKDFDGIAVRESSSLPILNSIGITTAISVLDPVFLLSKKQWMELISIKKIKEKYILIYAFNRQKNVFEYARKLSKETGYKVYCVNTKWMDYMVDKDKFFWCVEPEEFLSLIYNAEHIVTNSFHGLAFSIIFNKKVHVFTKGKEGNPRMLDLLKLFNIDDRLIKDETNLNLSEINYSQLKNILDTEVNKSKEYLNKYINKESFDD